MQNALELVGAVDDGSLVQLRVDAGQRRDIDDGVVACPLPDVRPHIDVAEHAGFGEERHGAQAQQVQQMIDDAALAEEYIEHADQNDGGDEVGRVGDHLRHLAQLVGDAVIEQQRQENRKGERGDDLIDAQHDGVGQQILEHIGMEELVKVLHAHPRAAPDALGRLEVAEGNLHAVHWPIVEDQQIDQRRQEEQVQHPVAGDLVQLLLPWRPDTGFAFRLHRILRRLQLNHILSFSIGLSGFFVQTH